MRVDSVAFRRLSRGREYFCARHSRVVLRCVGVCGAGAAQGRCEARGGGGAPWGARRGGVQGRYETRCSKRCGALRAGAPWGAVCGTRVARCGLVCIFYIRARFHAGARTTAALPAFRTVRHFLSCLHKISLDNAGRAGLVSPPQRNYHHESPSAELLLLYQRSRQVFWLAVFLFYGVLWSEAVLTWFDNATSGRRLFPPAALFLSPAAARKSRARTP